MNPIEITQLSKIFNPSSESKKVTALDNVSLNVEQGSIYGLLGPNGAGKTTMVKILLGITFATSGEAKILGTSISDFQVKNRVGYLPENHKFPNYLNGEDVLKYYAKLGGVNSTNGELMNKIDELLDLVKMRQWKKMKIKKYSKGMMQRLGLAQALINDPELIFLDEPTDGVDPIGRKEIRDILSDLKSEGKTIFVNSHLLSEVELVSDRVAILNLGKLIREGTVDELTSSKEIYKIQIDEEVSEDFYSTSLANFQIQKSSGNTFETLIADNDQLNNLIDKLRSENKTIKSMVPLKNSLEDIFISLIADSNKNSKL
ncbi:MAG: ABC transporter ATP-binding protein [Ignavibacteriae bacterium]|nr:ABC transporter ATP-binding protein [Ignavibacteriota bacterium]NOG96340.1 ABC transporter ATP-binding protein [Ignavibacteriota bacterium]